MGVTGSTFNLGLSQWTGTDTPKRSDFNLDNKIIDDKCGKHLFDRVSHITAEEREKWNKNFIVGVYFGTGVAEKNIQVGFKPRFVMVFTADKPLSMINSSECNFAIATEHVSSIGLDITDVGFKEYYGSPHVVNGINPKLNEMAVDYCYIAFR